MTAKAALALKRRGEVRQRLVLEVADGKLDHGVLAVL
jgi:hypothetical protein